MDPKVQNCDGNISPKIPHFFKIIVADTLAQGKLGIPKRYVRKHGNDLLGSSTALLRFPDGTQWEMGLAKSDGTIWLQNGWQEFVQHYSLKQGNFLVFRYVGSCRFDVVILDLSASEIDYPRPSSSDDAVDDGGGDDDDVSVEIIGEALRAKQVNGTTSEVQNWMEANSADHRRRGIEGGNGWTAEEKAKALGRAKGFKSSKPFFKVVMNPTSLLPYQSSKAYIPSAFAKKHASMKSEYAFLHLASGRSWQVLYHCVARKSSPRSSFRDGWREFVRDNDLKVGDVCVFEQVNPPALKFYVTIYRSGK